MDFLRRIGSLMHTREKMEIFTEIKLRKKSNIKSITCRSTRSIEMYEGVQKDMQRSTISVYINWFLEFLS